MTRVHASYFLMIVMAYWLLNLHSLSGVGRHERQYEVKNGEIDLNLDPTPAGIYYQVDKMDGDIRRTDFTLKWRVPATDSFDITLA